jgi:hypothetical protein
MLLSSHHCLFHRSTGQWFLKSTLVVHLFYRFRSLFFLTFILFIFSAHLYGFPRFTRPIISYNAALLLYFTSCSSSGNLKIIQLIFKPRDSSPWEEVFGNRKIFIKIYNSEQQFFIKRYLGILKHTFITALKILTILSSITEGIYPKKHSV